MGSVSLTNFKIFDKTSTNLVVVEKDSPFEIIYVNNCFLTSFGYKKTELISTNFLNLLDNPEVLEKGSEDLSLINTDEKIHLEIQTKSIGSYRSSTFIQSLIVQEKEYLLLIIDNNEVEKDFIENKIKRYFELKQALNESSIVVFTDKFGKITEVNEHFCKISGFSREELIGKTHRVVNSKTHPKEFYADMWSTIKGGKVWKGELRNKRKDGTYYWVSTVIVPLLDDDNSPIQYVAIRHDITQQKSIEENLKLNENYLETFILSMGDIILEVDENNTFTRALVDDESRLFLPRDQFLNKTFYDIFDKEMAEYWTELVHTSIKTGERQEIEYDNFYDNRPTSYRAVISLVMDEGATKRVSINIRDITETKRAERALKESEERYAHLISHIDGIVYIRRKDNLNENIFLSDSCEEIVGYTCEEFIKGKQRYYDLVHNEDIARVKETIISSINERKKYNIQYRVNTKDRGWIYVLEKGGGVWEGNELIRHEGIIVDINESILFEQQLAEKDKLYRLISENSGDWVALQNENYDWVYNSPSSEKITGYTQKELKSLPPQACIEEEDFNSQYKPALLKAQTGKTLQSVEYRFMVKTGEYRWFETTFSPIVENDKVVNIQSITRDIETRKRATEQLKNAEKLTNIGSWELNVQTNKLYWSDETHRIFELPILPEVVTYENFLRVVHPEDRKLLDDTYKRSVKNKEPYELVHRLLFGDGRIKYVKERGETYYDINGDPVRSIGSVQDITEKHLTNIQLIDLNEKLEEKVKERTEALMQEIANREKVEKEKLEGETNFQTIFNNIPAGIVVLETKNGGDTFVFSEINNAALDVTGLDRSKMVGREIGELYSRVQTSETEMIKAIRNVYLTGKTLRVPQYNLYHVSPDKYWDFYLHKLPGDQVVLVFIDVTNEVEMRNEIKESLEEKEILLDEIHHRVKNNLQVIIGLINLQQVSLGDNLTKEVLKESERRIRSMSLIHELIYGNKSYSKVDMNKYTCNLVDYLSHSFQSKQVYNDILIGNCELSISAATNVGIILTEAITNCYKYAFDKDEDSPMIQVSLKETSGKEYSLMIKDNGCGFSNAVDLSNANSLGLSLIHGMTKQMKGSVDLETSSKGTCYKINFTDNN